MERQQEHREEILLSDGSDGDDNVPDVATCQVTSGSMWGSGVSVWQ